MASAEGEEKKPQRRIFCTSDGLSTRDLQQEFKAFVGDCRGRTAWYIPTAAIGEDAPPSFLQSRAAQLKMFGFADVQIIDPMHVQGDALRERIKALNPACISMDVGNTYYLMHALRQSGGDEIITQAADNGTVILGSSAGSICLGETVQIAFWKGWDDRRCRGIEDVWDDKERARGLQLLGGRSIFPHASGPYGSKKWQDEQRRRNGHEDLEVIALANGQGVVIEGDAMRWVGV